MSHNHGKPFCMKEIDEQCVPGLVEIKNVFIAKEKLSLLGFLFFFVSFFVCLFWKDKNLGLIQMLARNQQRSLWCLWKN